MKEKRLRSLVALGVLPLALVACGAATNDTPKAGAGAPGVPGAAGSGTSVGAAGSGAGTAVGTAGTGAGVEPLPPPETCVPGVPVTTQIDRKSVV